MQRWTRIAAVTAGLSVAGGVFGTLVGMAVLVMFVLLTSGLAGLRMEDAGFLLELAIAFGGLPGAVLGPLAAWGLMRHVPLWLAVGGTTAGTLACGGLALLVTSNPFAALLWGMAGFGATAVALRRRVPRERLLLRD